MADVSNNAGSVRYGWGVPSRLPAFGSAARATAALVAAAVLGGCGPSQPPRWAQGGSPLALGAARWERDGGGPVELRADGKVLIDGDLAFVVDRAGRVANDEYDPYAVLLPDGELAGAGDRALGQVGTSNAAPPGGREAWLQVAADGRVTYFDSDGERTAGGVWHGCAGPVQRTCTLVTQLIALQNYRGSRSGLGIGIGVGVGVGVGF